MRPATNHVPFVSSRAFFPVRQSLRVSETLSMLIVRINTWLAQVGQFQASNLTALFRLLESICTHPSLAGGDILSVDSYNLTFPVDIEKAIDFETSTMVIKSKKKANSMEAGFNKAEDYGGCYWITGIQ